MFVIISNLQIELILRKDGAALSRLGGKERCKRGVPTTAGLIGYLERACNFVSPNYAFLEACLNGLLASPFTKLGKCLPKPLVSN